MSDTASNEPFKVERLASWLVVLTLVVFCLIYFSSFLQPVVIALMIWYSMYELRRLIGKVKFGQRKLHPWLVTTVAFVLIFLVCIGVFEIITLNLELITRRSPVYLQNFRDMVNSLQTIPGFENFQERIMAKIQEFDVRPIFTGLLNSITNIAGNVFLIIIYVAFLLVEEKLFYKKLKLLVPDAEKLTRLEKIIGQIVEAIRKYISVKTQMSLLTGILSYLILLLFDIDFPVLWAFIIFLLNYIPYIGSFFATMFPATFAMFQFQSFLIFVWVFVAIQAVQVLVGNVLEPKVMGKTLNLSPLGVLLALTFWGFIWGILGMFLSVPITSMMVITFSRFPATKFIAIWLSETGDVDYT
jgi:predicted PurR-regulated permease PerM